MSEYLEIPLRMHFHYQDMQKTFQEKLEEAPSAGCGRSWFGFLIVQSACLASTPLH